MPHYIKDREQCKSFNLALFYKDILKIKYVIIVYVLFGIMGKKDKKNKDKKDSTDSLDKPKILKPETIESIVAIVLIVLGIFLLMSAFGAAGFLGSTIYKLLTALFGIGYFLLPLILLALGISYLAQIKHNLAIPKALGAGLFLISALGLIDTTFADHGGIIGDFISGPLIKLFDFWFTIFFLLGLLIVSVIVFFDSSLRVSILQKLFKQKTEEDNLLSETEAQIETLVKHSDENFDNQYNQNQRTDSPGNEERQIPKKSSALIFFSRKSQKPRQFAPPPLSLLEKDSGKPGVGDIKANANIIKRTLANFGIQVEMDEISIGPSVTRYALKPAEGVKLSRIVALQNDLSLALAAHPLRIEAPIPGKSLVGIEIPNTTKTTVGLGSLLGAPEFQNSDKSLLVCLGKGITGQSHFTNIAKMPHVLIAGTTGSGKSVTINAIIASLLYKNPPENLKFIMVDPKRVELTLYNNIPHLLTPVITDAKKAILALKWAAKEMDRRYDILERTKVRDILSYHENIYKPAITKPDKSEEELPDSMPYIVIIIDELADIMQAYPRELESAIVRLAQMSRAVGIHLILSTQRPSVNVITGLIKANMPARIALQVSSQIDSRTILDMPGAEKLLGAGDMLYLSGEMSQPYRIQSAFISENEIKKVVDFLIDNYKDDLPDEIDLESKNQIGGNESSSVFDSMSDGEEDDDTLYEEAKQTVISAGKASTSYIQRKLRVGYARAARLMDILEERGVIGPADGSKPRDVLVDGNERNDHNDDSETDDSFDEESGNENKQY